MMRWITGFLLIALGQGFAPAVIQEQIRSSCHPYAYSCTSGQRADPPYLPPLGAAPGPSSVDEDYITPTKSLRHIGVMERSEGVTSTVSRKGPRRAETLKSAVSFSSIGIDQFPEMELSSKTLQAIKALDKEARLTLVRLADQLQALGAYAASRALADTDLVFRVSLVALAEISSLLSQRLLPGASPPSQDASDAADEGSISNSVPLSLKEKLTLVSLGISPTPSKTDFVMPSFSDAGDTDALVMDKYRKSEQRKTSRFQLPGLPSKASPVLSGVVGLLTSTASLPLSLVKAADALHGLGRTAETRRQTRKMASPLGVLKAMGKPLVALKKRCILPSPSKASAVRDPPSLPTLASSSSSRMLSSTSAPPRLAMVAQGQAMAALAPSMDDFSDRGALSWGHTMEAAGGVHSYGGISDGFMARKEAPFMTLSLPGSKAEDEMVIDTKIEVIQDEPSNIEKTVTTAIKVMDFMFVAVEHAAVKVVPEVADRAVLAYQRIQSALQGGAGNRQGLELLSALEDGASLAQRAVGGFSDFESKSKGQWRLRLR